MDKNKNTLTKNILSFLKNITIEPMLFLYYIGYYQLITVGENFRLDRYCRVSLDKGEKCDHLGDGTDEDLEVEVQKLENYFLMYESYTSVIFTVLLLMFIASWSDKHGRLVPMVLALGGWILYCVVYLLTVFFPSWSAWVLLLASFLRSMGGWHWTILLASYAHITDITTEGNRTSRMTALMATKGFGMSAGTALGPILYEFSGYALVYIVSIALFTICIIWSYLVIPHRSYKPEGPNKIKSKCEKIMTIARKLKRNLFELIDTSVRKRSGYSRFLINYLVLLMNLDMNSLPKKVFLWSRMVLKWDMDEYSLYHVIEQLMNNTVIFLVTPLIKFLQLHDCITGSIFQLAVFCKTLAFGLMTNPSQWYVPYVFIIVPQWLPSVCIRSLLSKQCGPDEIGRVYALLAVCECIWPIAENSLYGAVYGATVDVYPSAIHLVESFHSVIVFSSFLGIHLLVSWQYIKDSEESTHDDMSENENSRGTSSTESEEDI